MIFEVEVIVEFISERGGGASVGGGYGEAAGGLAAFCSDWSEGGVGVCTVEKRFRLYTWDMATSLHTR